MYKRQIARHEILCTFADITAAAKKLLKNKGKLFLVHRTFRLSEILCQLSKEDVYKRQAKVPKCVLSGKGCGDSKTTRTLA